MAARSDMKMNAIRSAIVALGALAFGYLSIQIGFKPFLEKAQQQQALQQSDPSTTSHESEFLKSDWWISKKKGFVRMKTEIREGNAIAESPS
ncbi:hypothetical protein L6164_012690 [Bauhinia variegata]|uniref:Uncharacterized protein n=1 Tax=Bauhinia variegata TaxID=167791 RepID=A0ACB9P9U7_BAUVA|nr:hypothetical protein L6164_012690 [Bauhinia variegata]